MKNSGFTLLELCLAIAIGVILLGVALPSLGGLFAEQRLTRSFELFDAMAGKARDLSMSLHKPCLLVWDRTGIGLLPEGADKETAHLNFKRGGEYDIALPAALIPKPLKQWVFWPTGTCEPANISYSGNGGTWIARYDPLTVRGTLSLNETH